MRVRLVCKHIKAPHPEHPLAAIDHFHWEEDFTTYTGEYDRVEMYKFLKDGNEAYVLDPEDPMGRARIYVTTAHTKSGEKYIVTKIHGQETDHILTLPDCSE